MKRRISLHPKLAAVLELLTGLVFVFLFRLIWSPWVLVAWFILRTTLWIIFVYVLAYYPPQFLRTYHFLSLLTFGFGMSIFLLFLYWPPAWYSMAAVLAVAPAVSFWLVPSGETQLSFVTKPFRRWRFLMTTMGVAGIWSGVQALFVFQIVPALSWWYTLGAALLTTAISLWWWQEYGVVSGARRRMAALVLFVCVVEAGLVALFSSSGNMAAGLALAWFWYVVWLMFRFYLSEEGIMLKKQLPFIVGNVILFVLYLLFIRWR